MDIGLDRLGKIEIDHQTKAGHIDAARGDIGGDKHLKLATLELAEHFQPDRLTHVTMQHVGIQPLLAKPVRQLLGAQPGAGKDQHLTAFKGLKFTKQDIALVSPLHQHRSLSDGVHGLAGPRHLDGHSIGQEGLGKGLHLVRHGRREKDCLAGLGKGFENALDRRVEPEIDHLVALVEDKMFDVIKLYLAARLQILEAARGGDNDIDALVQRANLEVITLTATDGQIAHLEASGERLDAVRNLVGEFARRRQNQNACTAHILGLALVQQLVKDRQQIGRRLAGAGLCQTDQVPAFKNGRNGVALDRRRGGQPLPGNNVDNTGRQAKLEKRVARKGIHGTRRSSGGSVNSRIILWIRRCGLGGHGCPSRVQDDCNPR